MPSETFTRPVTEPNMTPMIDVLLVMIIVFMVAVVQVYHTMDVVLPNECHQPCGAGDAIVLEVLPGPNYRLNTAFVSATELPDRLTSVYHGRPDKTIQVTGRAGVRYHDVMTAMDVARSAGVRVIGISPKEPR